MAYRETSRTRARKAAQHQSLIHQAEALVRAGGFEALTMQALADACDVGVGTVYRYFDGKDALACAVFSRATEREIRAVTDAIAGQDSPERALMASLRVFAQRALSAPRLAWALIAEPVAPALDSARLRYRERWTGIFSQLLERGVRAGSWPAQPTALVAAAMVGALAEALVGPLSQARQRPLHDAALVDDLLMFCLRATGTRSTGDSYEQQA